MKEIIKLRNKGYNDPNHPIGILNKFEDNKYSEQYKLLDIILMLMFLTPRLIINTDKLITPKNFTHNEVQNKVNVKYKDKNNGPINAKIDSNPNQPTNLSKNNSLT